MLTLALFILTLNLDSAGEADFTHFDAVEMCGLLSSPGDVLLQIKDEEGDGLKQFGNTTVALFHLKEALSLNEPFSLNYRHAEVITEIDNLSNLITLSFYQPFVQKFRPAKERISKFKRYSSADLSYRSDFEIFRAKDVSTSGIVKRREAALEKVSKYQNYSSMGSCGDFVNWAHGNYFTSWWNFLPGVRKGVAKIYPFENFRTPDNIADSPFSKKVCSVSEVSHLVYPGYICTKDLVRVQTAGLQSKNERIQTHSKAVLKLLENEGVVDSLGRVLKPKINFIEPLSAEKLTAARKTCEICRRQARQSEPRIHIAERMLSRSCKQACEMASPPKCR